MKVAIIHDWLTGMRGGEKCLEVFCELFPDGTIYTLVYNKARMSEIINKMHIKTSFIQIMPFSFSHYRYYLPLFPIAIQQFGLREYDLVISSSHCVANGVITSPQTLHLCYCHTPMRYIWDMRHFYFNNTTNRLTLPLLSFIIYYLRNWDMDQASKTNYYIANSENIKNKIKRYYKRNADVIYPPVDTSFYTPAEVCKEEYFLVAGNLAPYKRIDLAIETFNRMGEPLVIVGEGVEGRKLKNMAKKNIQFVGWQPQEKLREYFRHCQALIFPGEEDFGIIPLEAQACGRPVIAFKKGGVLESIIDGETGLFFEEQAADSLSKAIKKFKSLSFDTKTIRNHAILFDRSVFKKKINNYIKEKLENQK